jgi:glyoxylase-like metal-dependent hydrolase (beta-lactamase superfamily II)
MEVAAGIHRIEGRFAGRYLFQHVLVGERVLLVDTGIVDTPEELIFPYLESIGRSPADVDYVLSTHPDTDHYGGNGVVRRHAPKSRVLAHDLDVRWLEDADAMVAERYDCFREDHSIGDAPEDLDATRALCGDPVTVDVALRGGEWVALSDDWRVEIMHTPGHSEGHLSIWDPRSRTLVIADANMGRALPYIDGSAALAATYTHPGPYSATNDRLRERRAELLLTAHFPAMRGAEVDAFLDESEGLVDDIDTAVVETVDSAAAPVGLRELIDAVDARLGPLPEATKDTWAFPIAGHMDELVAEGRVTAGREADNRVVWSCGEESENAA